MFIRLNLVPRSDVKRLGMVVHAGCSSAGEQGTGGSRDALAVSLPELVSFKAVR